MKKIFRKITALTLASFMLLTVNLKASEIVETSQSPQVEGQSNSSDLAELAKDFDARNFAQYDKVTGQDEKNILEFLSKMPEKNLSTDINLLLNASADEYKYIVSYKGKLLKNSDNELSVKGTSSVNISNFFNFDFEPELSITLDSSSTETEKKYIVSVRGNIPGEEPHVQTEELKIDEETNKILDVLTNIKYDLRQVEEKDGVLQIVALIPIEENIDELIGYASEKGYLDENGKNFTEEQRKESLERAHKEIDKFKEKAKIENPVLPINLSYSTDTKSINSMSLDLSVYFKLVMLINALEDSFVSQQSFAEMKNVKIEDALFRLDNISEQEEKFVIEAVK